ncbi:MAG TPA: hypothetical protein VMG32_03060 [Anaeromyxobacteraceae bacterium]|nr:hypothetical protein [Anaeromyxobacteraceae bacterium]
MKASCGQCGRAYAVSDAYLTRPFKLRCKHCGSVTLVKPPSVEEGASGVRPPDLPRPPPLVAPDPVTTATALSAGSLPAVPPERDPFAPAERDPFLPTADALTPTPEPSLRPAFDPFGESEGAAGPGAAAQQGEGPPLNEFEAAFADLGREMVAGSGDGAAPPAGPAEVPAPVVPQFHAEPPEPSSTQESRKKPSPRPAPAPPAKKSKAPLAVGLLVAVAVLGGAGWFFLGGPKAPKPEASVPVRPVPAAAAASPAEPAPAAAPAPNPPLPPSPAPAAEAEAEPPPPAPAPPAVAREEAPAKPEKAPPAPKPAAKPPPPKKEARAAPPPKAKAPAPAPAPVAAPAPAAAPSSEPRVALSPAQPPSQVGEKESPEAPAASTPAASSNESPSLEEQKVTATFARYAPNFDACVTAARSQDPGLVLNRTVTLTITVNPSGKVAYPTLDDAELSGTELGNCIKRESAKMQFPPFGGESVRIHQGITLK